MTTFERVLVFEDDWFTSRDELGALHQAGCEVLGPFPCPVEAGKAFGAAPVDAAILDITMLDGTTFAFARRLRNAGIPVVFHSDWTASKLPADLADIPLVPKWRGPAAAVSALVDRMSAVRRAS